MSSPHPLAARRLSQRRGSSVAPDPFLQHEKESGGASAASGSSRITIVRVPGTSNPNTPHTSNPPSPGTHPRDFGPSSSARRSSWGSAKSGASSDGGGGGGGGGGLARGRMSFAFATFTPINPPGGHGAGGGPPDRSGAATPTGSSGPPSPVARRSFSNPSRDGPAIPRAANLTPQQLYEVAQQATNPGASTSSSPKYGYGGQTIPASSVQQGVQAAPFMPLPSEVYLPFINRPQEVTQQLGPNTPTGRLFALLASTFPQETNAAASISRPASAMSVRTVGGSTHMSKSSSDLPDDPKTWTFSQLSFWLRHVTRQEAPDREWIHKLRMCINSRSEVLWQRFAGALGVPPGFEEEEEESAVADDDDFDGSDGRAVGVGRTAHSVLRQEQQQLDSPLGPGDDLSPPAGDEEVDDFDDEYDMLESSLPGSEAIIEPITASSLPLPPSASGLTSPAQGLGLNPGETPTHALGDVREEDEEPETEPPASSAVPPRTYLGPGGLKDYIPRAHSPLASSTGDAATADAAKRPHLNITTPSIDQEGTEDTTNPREIDFTEPDPNAEPIQGIRIMNAPMTLFPSQDPTVMVASPGQFTPGQSPVATGFHPTHSAGIAEEMRPRTGSNSSLARSGSMGSRFVKHERTQSFGAFGLHNRRGSAAAPPGMVLPAHHPHGPHFPGSFAGVGVPLGNPQSMLLHNPRTATATTTTTTRPAGIPIGAGMHHTPRSGRGGFGSNLMASRLTSGSAVSLTDADGAGGEQ